VAILLRFVLLSLFAINIQAETLSLCAYFNWSPWIYAEGESYDGILMEQLALFREKNPNININIIEIQNWKRCQLEVARGNISMILGVNKTPEREKILDYLPRPALINRASVEAYALANRIGPVRSLDDLKNYSLSFARGDSFGPTMDHFIKSLPKEKIHITNGIYQSIKMVALGRVNYFLSVATSYKSTIREYNKKFRSFDHSVFEKIYTHDRAIPVFIAFGKGSGNYERYSDKWMEVIGDYHNKTNIGDRVKFHITKSGN
tara:strand:+ start:6416 stop:7201 length:786 start_codon:yes stop_codon:yes gene_type:complete